MLEFDPALVPFSRFGSYLALAHMSARRGRAAGLYLRSLHGDAPHREICRIEVLHEGRPLVARINATPAVLRLSCSIGHAELCFDNTGALHIRCADIALRFIFFPQDYDHAVRHPLGWEINSFSSRIRLALVTVHGEIQVHAPMQEGCARELIVSAVAQSEIVIREFETEWPSTAMDSTFSSALKTSTADFQRWLESVPSVPDRYAQARELAAYVQWSCVVAAEGNFKTPAMLMSKNWLTQVWSWDHCFNAMALSHHNPALAWDQFMLPFAQQNAEGALPDCISDKSIVWNFTKPPIHGWALLWMLQRTQFINNDQLQEIYQPLARWTEWWLRYRDDNSNGIAQYNHGNDSGWDNCTLFDSGVPLETPDLSAFLILQMEALAEIAQRLQQPQDELDWRHRAQQLLEKMLNYFWRDDGFVAIDNRDGTVHKTQTLLLLLPLLLGKRLPTAMRTALLARLQQSDLMTVHGLASESVASPAYRADGYWRGPVWAPALMLIVSGLVDMGERALAQGISQRFCDTVARSGMAENFDAQSGAGLRDPSHTWTASVFLMLAHGLAQVDSAVR